MKKILLLAALLATATSMFGQGVVLFNNRVGTSPNFTVDAPITNGATGLRIDGNDLSYRCALYGAAGAVADDSSFTMMTNPQTGQGAVGFRNTPATFGYVLVGTEGNRSLPGLGFNSAVTVQIRAWGGGYATYEAAQSAGAPVGKSNFITLTTTLNETDPNIPPLAGIQGFAVVPEPSSIALGLLGLGALALIRRRK